MLWSLNTLTTSLKDLLHPRPSSYLHSFHISCCRTLILQGNHTHPYSFCRRVAHLELNGAIIYLLTETLTFLSACLSLGQSWSSLPHFSTATNPKLPAVLPPQCNQEMHFRRRLRTCHCFSTPSSSPKHMAWHSCNSKRVKVEMDRKWMLEIEH